MSIKRRCDSGAWEVSIPRPGLAPLRKSSSRWTRADAHAVEQKLLNNHHTLEHGLDKWLLEYAVFLRAHKSYESAANILRPLLKDKSFDEVPEVVSRCKRAWGTLAPATINRRLAILRRVCSLAFKEWGWLAHPISKKVALLKEDNERHYYLTRAEVERLRMNCTIPEAGNLIVLAAFTGLRLGELLRIKPGDLRGDELQVPKSKNMRPRILPLHPRALHIAQRLPYENVTKAILRKQWVAAREEAGMGHIHFHDLRHTFASWMIQSGTPIHVLKDLMGHKSIHMTMRYAHLATSNLRAAIQNMDAGHLKDCD